jgi:hypothetical protein
MNSGIVLAEKSALKIWACLNISSLNIPCRTAS